MQLGPLEVGVLVAATLALWSIGRAADLRAAFADGYRAFRDALSGVGSPGATAA